MFVLAMVILTIGEATALPTIPALVNVLTPIEAKGALPRVDPIIRIGWSGHWAIIWRHDY